MEFQEMLKRFTTAVEQGDGAALAALFTEEGIYHDTFYGEYKGREAIQAMLEERFHGDAENFLWDMHAPVCGDVSGGNFGYACWNFSYTSTSPESAGKRVVIEGMSCFEMEGGAIRRYSEKFDSGMALTMLDFAPERLVKLFSRWNEEKRGREALRRHFAG